MTVQTIIVISSDALIVNAAEVKQTTEGRNPVQVYAYHTSKRVDGWSQYDGTAWNNSVAPTLNSNVNVVSFSGHGNQDEIGSAGGTSGDVGPDLTPQNTADILNGIGFKQNKILLSVCSTSAIYKTFAESLANALVETVGSSLKPGIIQYPSKSISSSRDPLSTADMLGVDYM
jgi:hypothetical protein